MSRLIDADALERDGWRMSRTVQIDENTMEVQTRKPTDFPAVEPQPEPEEFEWCTDCKEYDQDKHCCHRWTKVIRQTVEELKQAQNIIHCKDCIHIHDNDCPISWGRQDFDYCSWAERRQDDGRS